MDKIDAHLVVQDGMYVLLMTPFVAKVVRDMSGLVDGNPTTSEARLASDKIWDEFNAIIEWDHDTPLLFAGQLTPCDDHD